MHYLTRALRPPLPRTPEHEQAEQEHAAILAAIAQDRTQRRHREAAWHVALVAASLVVTLAILGAKLLTL